MKKALQLKIKDLTVQLDDFLISNLDLEVQNGEYFILLGPTGAGKTVLLEAVAGIISPVSGTIHLEGIDVTNSSPEFRKVGFVYQDYALFPHLTVEENISFGLENRIQIEMEEKPDHSLFNRPFRIQQTIGGRRKFKQAAVKKKVDEISSLLRVSHLLDRKPSSLSGGEQQRVALARALIINPSILLFDEPLRSLDPETQEQVQRELRRVHQELGTTILHITHDFEIAVALADRIGVIIDGKIIQVGTPREIFRQPINEQIARFVGVRNIFRGRHFVEGDGSGLFNLNGFEFASISKLEGTVRASIRPEDILLSRQHLKSSARNNFQGKIIQILDRGPVSYITVRLLSPDQDGKNLDLEVLITQSSVEEFSLALDMEVYIAFKASALHIF
jgi:molybdopterin-binding protein